MSEAAEITQVLQAIGRSEEGSAEKLLPLVYAELRRLAAARMAQEMAGQTLQPTALVHEAWLRIAGDSDSQFQNRAHFFGAAAEAMRRILIDRARRKHAVRHGGGSERIGFDELEIAAPAEDAELLAVNDALARFATVDAKKAELVKLRYFAGMTIEEAASVLGISEPMAKRWWTYARAWLFTEIKSMRP